MKPIKRSTEIEIYIPCAALSAEALGDLKFITFPRGARLHLELEDMILKRNLPRSPKILNCVSVLTMRNMAERGLGVATLPVPLVDGDRDLERIDVGFTLPSPHFTAT